MSGELALDVRQFTVDTQPGQLLVACTPPPASPSREALGFLLRSATGDAGQCADIPVRDR